MICSGRGEWAINRIGIKLEDLVKLVRRIYLLFRDFKGKMQVGIPAPLCLLSDDFRYSIMEISACNVLIHAGVNWNGDIGPCVYYLGPGNQYVIGNLRKHSLKEIWFSEEFKSSRRRFKESFALVEHAPPCNICIRREVCFGECPALAFQTAGILAQSNNICLELYKNKEYRRIITEGFNPSS